MKPATSCDDLHEQSADEKDSNIKHD